MGCSLAPPACVQRATVAAEKQQVGRVTLAVTSDLDRLSQQAALYSQLSLQESRLAGIGVDDFYSALKRWLLQHPLDAMTTFGNAIRDLRSRNSRLQFGITLYEDELDAMLLKAVPNEVRARIDLVSLYLHYRKSGPDFARFVTRVKQLFPNARIIGGSYAYDRIDYLPCARDDSRKCTEEEELQLFESSLKIQAGLVRSGVLGGIEFYPGSFGEEATWEGWNNERLCRSTRRQECIDLTRRLRQVALRVLSKAGLAVRNESAK